MSAVEQDTAPRPPTPTQRLELERARSHELTMATLTRTPSQPEHSLSLTRNAKGVTQVELTGRGHDLAELVATVTELYDGLRARYPLPSGFVGAEGEPAPVAK